MNEIKTNESKIYILFKRDRIVCLSTNPEVCVNYVRRATEGKHINVDYVSDGFMIYNVIENIYYKIKVFETIIPETCNNTVYVLYRRNGDDYSISSINYSYEMSIDRLKNFTWRDTCLPVGKGMNTWAFVGIPRSEIPKKCNRQLYIIKSYKII